MSAFMEQVRSIFMESVPDNLLEEFGAYSAKKNNIYLCLLAFASIFVQAATLIIYLYLFPVAGAGALAVQERYSVFSFAYILFNAFFALFFFQFIRNEDKARHMRRSHIWTLVYLALYCILEAVDMVFELSMDGNLYRFLGVFCLLAFLPLLRRLEKFSLLLLYPLAAEIGLRYFADVGAYYQDIIPLLTFLLIAASNIAYSSTIRGFTLHRRLLETNRQLQEANAQLEHLSSTDPLTGIANRRLFDERITALWNERKRSGEPLTVYMIDIDKFKDFNDKFGHQAGDLCLRIIAQYINGFFRRASDLVARYGGEEFVVLLANEKPVKRDLADKLRRGIAAQVINIGEPPAPRSVTVSIGVGTMIPSDDNHYADLIALADDALYRAKHGGRNRVCHNELGTVLAFGKDE